MFFEVHCRISVPLNTSDSQETRLYLYLTYVCFFVVMVQGFFKVRDKNGEWDTEGNERFCNVDVRGQRRGVLCTVGVAGHANLV